MLGAEPLGASPTFWSEAKQFAEHAFGVSPDGLHVVLGPCLQLFCAALFRTSLRSIWPWLIVLVLATLNEWHDLAVETWPSQAMQLGEGAKDIVITMVLPTILLLTARFAPGVLTRSDLQAAQPEREP
jgi:hypothetical protein